MDISLLATKTFIPAPQSQWVVRERLLARLNAGLENRHRLFLVSAAAGCGKSALLTAWVAQAAAAIAWVELDVEDNDPVRFWSYCLTALRAHDPQRIDALLERLNSPQPPELLPFLTEVVNRLTGLADRRLVLVLDDYHVIEAQAVHDSLSYFLEHTPPGIQVALATRSDPPLPLHRWRGRGQLTEIRFDDLRFTLPEIGLYFSERMKLDLSAEDIAQLEKRTEGWIVGLHLAALLMRGRQDVSDFVARFSASNHYVLEYLTNEVLDLLPEEEQDFLLQISILPQFNPALCAAVTGRADSQAFLDRFWKANLFLIPLDDDHFWYRYHHLFADLLRHTLKQRGEAVLQVLYQRAADWYAGYGMSEEAIRCALAARNYPMAAGLILKNRRRAMNAGDFRRFFTWMEQIPTEVLAADAHLSFVYGAMLYNNGQIGRVEEYLNAAQQAYERLAPTQHSPEDASLPGQIAAFRAMLALRHGDLRRAAQAGEEALRLAPDEDVHTLGMAGLALGLARSEMGQWQAAMQTYHQAVLACERSDNRIGAAVCRQQLAGLLQLQGAFEEARALLESALESSAGGRLENVPATGVLMVALAESEYERNRLAQAGELLEQGLALVRQGGFLDSQKTAAVLQAKLYAAAGDLPEAIRVLQEAQRALRQISAGLPQDELAAYLACCQARLGAHHEALAWAEGQNAAVDEPPGFTRSAVLFCLARVWIEVGKLEDAGRLLERLGEFAGEGRCLRSQAEAGLLRALIALRQDHRADGLALLEECLRTLAGRGYRRLFLDEGAPLRQLLLEFQKEGRHEQPAGELAQELLASFGGAGAGEVGGQPAQGHTGAAAALVEKLSERELEVLALMAEGLTNPEIAGRLFLSLSTIKTHLNNIYGKLNVRNRAEAVLRAKELGLL